MGCDSGGFAGSGQIGGGSQGNWILFYLNTTWKAVDEFEEQKIVQH